MIFHLHIPKTGGSSLETLLRREYDGGYRRIPSWSQRTPNSWHRDWWMPDKLKGATCLTGHYHWAFMGMVRDALPTERKHEARAANVLLLLRNPVDRLLSLYHYWKTNPQRWQKTISAMSFEQFAMASRRDWPFLDNDQCRRVSGMRGGGGYDYAVTGKALRAAQTNLGGVQVIGITERFDETVARWANLYGWESTAYDYKLRQPDRLRRQDLSARVIRMVEERQAFDLQLWRWALARDWGGVS